MPDPRNVLQSKFRLRHRFSNFGNVISKMVVRGFRCHPHTIIDIQSPITAFCGLNGVGKSTLIELAACAYKNSNGQRFNISNFFAVGQLDPAPFSTNAYVEYHFDMPEQGEQVVTISRNRKLSRWNGYVRRPERNVVFIGQGLYVSRYERRDFVVRESARLYITESNPIGEEERARCCEILGLKYEEIEEKTVRRENRETKVLSSSIEGNTYSETHMGFGEGRVQTLIKALESVEPRSLILIEEPEYALHQSAQYRLGRYLVDLCIRKGHQIFLTTHSEHLLRALPQLSSIYLHKIPQGIETIPGLPPAQAVSLMAEGSDRAITLLVEDDCAKIVLSEILRHFDSTFLASVRIAVAGYKDDSGEYVGGGKDAITRAMGALANAGLRVAAVLDPDASSDPQNYIFKLPGQNAPEWELINSIQFREILRKTYQIQVDDFIASSGTSDCHRYFPLLAAQLNVDPSHLLTEAARSYASECNRYEAEVLIEQLKDAGSRWK